VTPGNSTASVVMTISTTAATSSLQRRVLALWLVLPVIFVVLSIRSKTRTHTWQRIGMSVVLIMICVLPSCGGASSGGGNGGQPGTPPGPYQIIVVGTSGSLQHKVTVGLTVSD